MELISLLGAMTTTGFVSVAAAQYLSKRLLDHRLSKDLKDYDASLSEKLAEGEAHLKKEIEEYLGERSADRAYRAEAKKRLYLAVGPLRFQLLVAAAELVNRIARIGDGKYTYDMSIKGYVGQSTAYRLLRVLAVSELVERQIAYADFAVDPDMRSLLRFKRQAFLSLSSSRVSLGHPSEDWTRQEQHIFYDVLGIIASSLIVLDTPSSPGRVIRFDEFSAMVADKDFVHRLDPVPRLINGFSITTKSILWIRLLTLAQLCIGLLENHGKELGLEIDQIDIDHTLKMTEDTHVRNNLSGYRDAIASFRLSMSKAEA